jgi:hypothetical protein
MGEGVKGHMNVLCRNLKCMALYCPDQEQRREKVKGREIFIFIYIPRYVPNLKCTYDVWLSVEACSTI